MFGTRRSWLADRRRQVGTSLLPTCCPLFCRPFLLSHSAHAIPYRTVSHFIDELPNPESALSCHYTRTPPIGPVTTPSEVVLSAWSHAAYFPGLRTHEPSNEASTTSFLPHLPNQQTNGHRARRPRQCSLRACDTFLRYPFLPTTVRLVTTSHSQSASAGAQVKKRMP